MIKPKVLKKGDTIGLVSPSSALAGLLPHKFEMGIKALENMGFKVKVGKNALKTTGYTAGTAEERAEDLNDMFKDPEVSAIMAMIGGFHANQIIDLLDYEMIAKNPKIFIGFSDITVLHFALNTQSSLVTFYGPALLTQFGGAFGVENYVTEYLQKALMSSDAIGKVEPSKEWTDEFLDWFAKKDLERPKIKKSNKGFIWLKNGKCEGELIGGCITSMLHLRGTKYWPNFKNKIFFWELAESSNMAKGEPIARIDAHLTDLRLSGVFDQISGMMVGRPYGYSDEEFEKLKNVILSNTKGHNFPILYNIDIGHTDPIMTIPLGVKAKLDSDKNEFEITESGVI